MSWPRPHPPTPRRSPTQSPPCAENAPPPDCPRSRHRPRWLALSLAAALVAPSHAESLDLAWSGFGTFGYAQSNTSQRYQRFIDEHGTFKRDSVLGGQLDLRLADEWSATVQATVAPSLSSDEKLDLAVTWAFLSWRPSNDWLLRLGKQRLPLFLHTENRDVGQTYDMVRPPVEVYAVSPSTDMTGLSIGRTWFTDRGEWVLDAYTGAEDLDVRTYARDAGTTFLHVRTRVTGMALSLKLDSGSTFRGSLYRAETRRRDGQAMTAGFPAVDLPMGLGTYYQVDPALPGPGVRTTSHIVNDVITVGADVAVADNWRVMGEVARVIQHKSDLGANTIGGYLAVLHKMDRYTPYVSIARLRSLGASLKTAESLDAVSLSPFVTGGEQVSLSQRVAADSLPVYDQTSLAIGLSYALTPHSKVKGEWMRTHVGKRSAMVDGRAGDAVFKHADLDVFSLNYSFAF